VHFTQSTTIRRKFSSFLVLSVIRPSGSRLYSVLRPDARRVCIAHSWFDRSGTGAADCSLDDVLDDVVDSIAQRIDRPTAIAAQSMGGVLALLADLKHPESVTHLVLAATSGGVPVRRLGGIDWQTEFARNHPSVPDWLLTCDLDLSAQLRTVVISTLLVWGDSDPISPVAVGKNLAALLPQAKLRILPGGDHDFAHTRPQCVAPLIEHHLNGFQCADNSQKSWHEPTIES